MLNIDVELIADILYEASDQHQYYSESICLIHYDINVPNYCSSYSGFQTAGLRLTFVL